MKTASPVAIVTGAGSGVGRAVTLKLAAENWRVALVGRRAEALAETQKLAGSAAPQCVPFAADMSDAASVERTIGAMVAHFGRVDALVAAAGTNIPQRSWLELSSANYEALLATNLHGVFHSVRALLPGMKKQGAGTFIFINSEAGLRASPKAGVAYAASKFGLTGLAQSLNAEERGNGIRACSIFPGDIDTPLLDKRPAPPPAEARARMLRPDDVAACVWLALSLPRHAIVEELVVRPA